MRRLIIGLASVGFIGYCPVAPGTAGTLVGVLVYYLFSFFPAPIYVLSTVAALFLAWWAAELGEIIFAQKDCPRIVIDEVVGYLISMALLPRTLTTVVGGFIFFRILDIIKPPPAGAIDRRMRGGLGVVFDDVVAGIYTNILLRLIIHWRPDFLNFLERQLFGSG